MAGKATVNAPVPWRQLCTQKHRHRFTTGPLTRNHRLGVMVSRTTTRRPRKDVSIHLFGCCTLQSIAGSFPVPAPGCRCCAAPPGAHVAADAKRHSFPVDVGDLHRAGPYQVACGRTSAEYTLHVARVANRAANSLCHTVLCSPAAFVSPRSRTADALMKLSLVHPLHVLSGARVRSMMQRSCIWFRSI